MDPLVSVEWLAARLNDPRVLPLDATLPPVGVVPPPDVHARFLQGHIPGAVFFDIEALSDRGTDLPHMLQAPADFEAAMAALGISETLTLVVYEQEGVFSAPRAWWMLRCMGVREVYVLDGGLPAWVAAGEPLATGEVKHPQATFHAHFDAASVRTLADVQQLTRAAGQAASDEQLVDARSAGRFAGSMPEPRPGLPSGHMPGARNLPFVELADQGRLKPPAEAAAIFAERGVDIHRPVTVTCGSGVTAAVLALELERCGASQVRLYDGSWAEYARQPAAEIATGTAD